MSAAQALYQQQIELHQAALKRLRGRYNFFSYARLGVFLGGIALCYGLFQIDYSLGIIGGLVSLIVFLYLIKRHTEIADAREHLKRLISIHEQELQVLAGNWHELDEGKQYQDPKHAYTSDLDFFGRGSVFQYLNRTGTVIGRDRLAHWLRVSYSPDRDISSRQAAVQELADKQVWNLNFQALGLGKIESADDPKSLLGWLHEAPYFSTHRWYPRLIRILPICFGISLLLWLLPDFPGLRPYLSAVELPGMVPLFFFLLQLGVVGKNLKRTARQQILVGRKSNMLNKYAALLDQIESEPFASDWLQTQLARLQIDGQKAGDAIRRLGVLTYYLDQRLNAFAGLLLNGMIMWDLQYLVRLEKWRAEYQTQLPIWFEVIAEVDATVSLARFAFNRDDCHFPTEVSGDFQVRAEGLGHPLLDPATRVDNDFSLSKPGEFLIITGANMAGKSTFLRTVGVNLVLAMIGAPVCARSFRFVPIPLMTSVRAHDSLTDHESYFYAELKQLKRIIDALKTEAPIFIIVDEMLRGTNSRDKQVGSRKFIEQLIGLGGVGLIATHDLSLGTLADDYPDFAFNKRFEVEIKEDQLHFDYRLQDGISQNLNATFLMQKMGIMP